MAVVHDMKTHKERYMENTRKTEISESDNECDIDSEYYKITTKIDSRDFTCYLSDEISPNALDYHEFLTTMSSVKAQDQVTIHLSNFGGAVHSGMRVAHAIRDCAGTTVVVVEGPCYSMGAIIAISGDAVLLKPGTFLMFHNYTSFSIGKGGELRMSVEEFDKAFSALMHYFASPFITKKELERLKHDKDLYVHARTDDFRTRCLRHFPLMRSTSVKKQLPKKRGTKNAVSSTGPRDDGNKNI